ncbi:hypothetical protein ACRALDRAFT_2109435 [Sodiomyces alcalophilus JCM 7366]|uniref:uncharacterized protein n=1 Tax=Sodiomyces alcalophilus JCM 7366 TaxID=591952 RepID=UPI0039B5B324
MPPVINHAALASAGIAAVSIAVTVAIAIYESPEFRRLSDDVRRRVAIALQSLGENIEPPERPPRFNRPEDAEGFYESRRGAIGDPGVEADEATRRQQLEELMHWNAVRLEKQERERREAEKNATSAPERPGHTRGSSFDDFLRQDENGERGAFVFNTGTDARSNGEGLLRNRHEAARSLNPAVYANPFADENQIDLHELPTDDGRRDVALRPADMSDIYSATTRDPEDGPRDAATLASPSQASDAADENDRSTTTWSQSESSGTLDRELGRDEYMTAGQDDRNQDDPYSSIQAWAQGSATTFYSPLPMSPAPPESEPEMVSEAMMTPTDSVSLAGSGEDIANDVASSRAGETGRDYDVLSESDDAMMTPSSWSEVGSVISEAESHPARNAPMPAS